jgi:hypothetical protein
VVAQGPAPEHWRVGGDDAELDSGEGLIFLLNLRHNRNLARRSD